MIQEDEIVNDESQCSNTDAAGLKEDKTKAKKKRRTAALDMFISNSNSRSIFGGCSQETFRSVNERSSSVSGSMTQESQLIVNENTQNSVIHNESSMNDKIALCAAGVIKEKRASLHEMSNFGTSSSSRTLENKVYYKRLKSTYIPIITKYRAEYMQSLKQCHLCKTEFNDSDTKYPCTKGVVRFRDQRITEKSLNGFLMRRPTKITQGNVTKILEVVVGALCSRCKDSRESETGRGTIVLENEEGEEILRF